MSFDPSMQFYRHLETSTGVPFYLRVDPGSYTEFYIAGGSQIVAEIVCRWGDREKIVEDFLGSTTFSPSAPDRFTRKIPQAVPWRPDLLCSQLTLISVGTFDDENVFLPLKYPPASELAGQSPVGRPTFLSDASGASPEQGWPEWGHCVMRGVFTNRPFVNILRDDQLPPAPGDFSAAPEFLRFTTHSDQMSVRERRQSDCGFKTVDTNQTIELPGFVVDVEKYIEIRWYQIPFDNVPRDRYESEDFLLKVNDEEFDRCGPTTLLFLGAKNYTEPYRGGDGRLYADPVLMFRYRPTGWNKVLRNGGSGLEAVDVVRKGTGQPPYARTLEFYKLFQPSF